MKIITKAMKRKAAKAMKPTAGRSVQYTDNDSDYDDISASITPRKITTILNAALSGDTADQCRLALEITEKDWDIAHAIQTRVLEVSRTDWRILPFSDDKKDQKVAEYVATVLKSITGDADNELVGMRGLLQGMMSGLMPGFAGLEVVWEVPGESIAGFHFIEPHNFTFADRIPKLITEDNAAGEELADYKFIFHRHKGMWGGLNRGGLIRPLSWLYTFKNLNMKDLLRYTEKVGIPFIYANISDEGFREEARKISAVLRRFGSDGAGVFSSGTEINSMNRQTGGEEVFIKCQDIFRKAIPKLILGTRATSDSEDSNYSNSQTGLETAQKYREDDCDALSETLRNTIIKWLVGFKFGTETPLPFFDFDYDLAEDADKAVTQVKTLTEAGFELEPEQIEERTGWRVTRVESGEATILQGQKTVALSANSDLEPSTLNLKPSHASPWNEADKANSKHLQAYLEGSGQSEQWQPLQDAIDHCLDTDDEKIMQERLLLLLDQFEELLESMDDTKFVEALEATIFESYANSMVTHSNEV